MRSYKNHESKIKEIFNNSFREGSKEGEYAKKRLNEAFNLSNETLYDSEIVSKVKVGDIFILKNTFKSRPYVVCKVNKDVCNVVSLTTSDGYMNTGILANSRFFNNGKPSYYANELTMVSTELVSKFFIGTIDTVTEVRKAYKHIVNNYAKNIKL